MNKVPRKRDEIQPELQFFEDFVSQNTVNARTIKCSPPGIGLERFSAVCSLEGAPESVRQSIASFVSDTGKNGCSSVGQQHAAVESILKVVHENTKSFVTLEQYVWLARLAVAAELLQNVPQRTDAARKRLCKALESMRLDAFNHSPACVHLVAKALVEDIPLDSGLNLLHVIKKLAIYDSQLLYYVAVALLFAGLDATVKPKTARHEYCVRDVNAFLSYLNEFNLLNIKERHDDLQNIYNTLKLFSLYENMILLREYDEKEKELEREHKTYADCFRVNVKQRNTFRRWLDRSRSMVHVFGSVNYDVNYLLLSDVIENEMRPLFDDFCVPEEL